jgi:hypothetical protein
VVPVRHDERNGPPGGRRAESAEQDERLAGGKSDLTLDDPVPLYRSPEFDALDPDDTLRWQSTIRAADAWWAEGQPNAIRARLLDELADDDALVRWRLRHMSWDLSEAADWSAIANLTPIAELRRLRLYGTEVAS